METLRKQAIKIIQRQNERVRQDILNEDDDEVIKLTTLGLAWEKLKLEVIKIRNNAFNHSTSVVYGVIENKMKELEKEVLELKTIPKEKQ